MRQLLPEVIEDVDVYEALRPDRETLVRVNFVTSLDGSVTDAMGSSRGLGGECDQEVFRTLRAHADAILVGAETVRVERYGPHRLPQALAARRRADGRPAPAPIVVVSGSLRLDWSAPLFTAATTPTVVVTHAGAPASLLAEARRAGRLLVAGRDEVDLALALTELRAEGLSSVLCEGGPRLFSALLAQGVVDELCLTLAPTLVGGATMPMLTGFHGPTEATLVGALAGDGDLALRYRLRHR